MALKGNQETLSREVENLFAQAETKNSNVKVRQSAEKVEIGHGRIEQRRYSMIGKLDTLSNAEAWEGLRSVGMVESVRIYQSKVSTERRYYITSLQSTHTRKFATAVRAHWGIENRNHYVRDVSMLEDASRIRINPGIFARTRSFALNILRANGEENIADALWCNALNINRPLKYRYK